MDDSRDMVEHLLAVAGSLLEDGSGVALAMDRSRAERIAELQSVSTDLGSLLAAAAVVERGLVD